MSARWLLVVLCIAICTTHVVSVDQAHRLRNKIMKTQQAAKTADVDIKFIKPKSEHTEPLDPMVFTQKPAIIGTQPPAVQRIPTPPSAFTHAPRIITAEDLKPDESLYGDNSAATSLVTTADSHQHQQDPIEGAPPSEPTPSADSTTDTTESDSSTGGVPTIPTPTETEVEAPVASVTGGDAMGATSTGIDESGIGENAEDAKHKFRNSLANDAIPKWFNVKDFVDEESGLEFDKAREEATKIVEAELAKFKTEVLGTIMEQFGKIVTGGGAGAADETNDPDGDYDYDSDGGEGEGEGETYHEGYLDGEDDASQAGDDSDATGADAVTAGDDTGDDSASDANADAGTAAATTTPAQTPQDAQVIASLQAEVDQMKNQLVAKADGAATPPSTAEPTASLTDTATEASASASTPATPATDPATAETTPAVDATATETATTTEATATPTPTAEDGTTEASSSEASASTSSSSDEEATAAAGSDEEDAGSDEYDDEEYGDEDGGDEYDYYEDEDGGDEYDYDYDGEGGEEWGHDHTGRWGRKSGGGGGWASMSAPAAGAGAGSGTVKTYGQSGGSAGFTTTVSTSTPKTITTVIGTTITPLGNGQTTIAQNVERVQVDEYDDGVGSPGWQAGAVAGKPAEPNPADSIPPPTLPDPEPVNPTFPVATPTPTPVETIPTTPATPATPAPATPAVAEATTTAAATLGMSAEAMANLVKIKEASQNLIAPVHSPTSVDLKNLKALEDSSDLLTRAADEVQRLSSFREKRRLEKLLGKR